MVEQHVGLLGATSLIGECLLPLLTAENWQVNAFSRNVISDSNNHVVWKQLRNDLSSVRDEVTDNIPYWISVMPIWCLPDYFDMLQAYGVRRIVVLSSTSRFTKDKSSDLREQAIAHKLAFAENSVKEWGAKHDVDWIILRPTLIYGLGRDKNITEIARFIRRFKFFPLFGKANGLRQPVHCQEVAEVCVSALKSAHLANRAYNIAGGETLSYRELVVRIFRTLALRPRFFLFRCFCLNWPSQACDCCPGIDIGLLRWRKG
nr:NAD(P)-dependent oxidoreductase [Methylomarinum sp. Ch1-1]MDP4522856.1 NAD(P)-dependent oxidoreductase [Methylomarinum sp. Ch1-1]